MKKNTMILAGVVLLISGYIWAQKSGGGERLTPVEVQNLITADSTVVILDVRTPAEFVGELGHIKGAILVPVQELDKRVGELAGYKKNHRVIAVCRSGHRSQQAVSILKASGFDAIDMAGGMNAWNGEKLPVTRSAN